MKILHVIAGLHVGGAETMLCKLLERSDRERFQHGVVTLLPAGPLRTRALDAGARVSELGLRRRQIPAAAAAGLVRLMRRERPDIIQGWMYHGNLAATFGSLLTRQANGLIWSIRHSLEDLPCERRLTRLVIRVGAKLSKLPSAIVYNSAASAQQHESMGYASRRTQVIPNGFDCEALRAQPGARERLRRDLGIRDNAVIVGMVARYHPIKDHANLIHAVGVVAERQPVHLVLIGQGMDWENPALATMLRTAGIGHRTSLLGERADIPDLVAGLDVFALSSKSEAFPQVLGEAMACGVPCVATDVGECRNVLGETGLIVPARDPGALAQAVGTLVQAGPERRRGLGAAARDRVMERYALDSVVRRFEHLYEQSMDDH